ncbi:MAG: zinc metalloprotease HtpX [Zetaproteobacteria bacterium CG2_30_46_52]|nr:MAG: zinc metalloprotease HtpX [Zetaproteobacteria bacterium CG2_30_46_52]
MGSLKGIGMLIIANILIMVTLAISANVLVYFVLPMFGIDVSGSFEARQLMFAAVFGFGGAFISLWMSKWLAKRGNKMQQVVNPSTPKEKLVYDTVEALAKREGIKMPEVWVYWDDVPNAFATGPSRNNSMVAVSSGLAMNLSDAELKAVLAHEVGHIANGDMVATTLLQGLMNTIVYFLASMVARLVATAMARGEEPSHLVYFIVDMILQIMLSFLAAIVVCAFSRRREFKADAYAADALGADAMISALQKIDAMSQRSVEWQGRESREDALATMKIYAAHGGIAGLFATHPSIEDRVNALRNRR